MSVEFSRVYGCYVWHCVWGCMGIDHESEQSARDEFLNHPCEMTS